MVVRGVMDSEWLADAHAAIDANAGSSLMTEVPEAVLEENVPEPPTCRCHLYYIALLALLGVGSGLELA